MFSAPRSDTMTPESVVGNITRGSVARVRSRDSTPRAAMAAGLQALDALRALLAGLHTLSLPM